jgi:hypothetical protein
VDRKITAFFAKHLLQERPSGGQASPG